MLFLAMLLASTAVVDRPVADMYSGPSADRDVVSQAIYGTKVGVMDKMGEWARIRTPDDYDGWVPAASILPGGKYAEQGKVAEVQSLFAHLYREPSVTKHAPVLTVPFETRLEVATASDEWLQVRLVDGGSAWVQQGDVSLDSQRLSIPETIALAKRFLGLPYTWGGTSSFGYDCSGYMQMLCRRRGYNLPRDAQPQADWTGVTAVARNQLQPGDLLYFGSSDKNITHTGMYIGNDEFIHATTHDRPVIQIGKVSDPHWTELLVACRRVK